MGKKEKLPGSKSVAGTVELQTKKVRGVVFGVGRCTVSIGPAGVDAVAVKAGKKRRVVPADDGRAAAVWLKDNSGRAKLSLHEAQNLVLDGLCLFDACQKQAAAAKSPPDRRVDANLANKFDAMGLALQRIRDARDFNAAHGTYPLHVTLAHGCFDDWAADLVDEVLDGGTPGPDPDVAVARSLVRRLRDAVQYANDVFAETCDCGTCGPCRKRRHFAKLFKDAAAFL